MAFEEKFEFESLQDSQTIKDFLESLIQGIENKKIQLSTNGDEILLQPNNMLKFQVKARRKKDTSKLVLKISWKNSDKGDPLDKDPIVINT
ncbi:amphi-Trp domain-containing protein [Desulfatibacillum alkenivorans DSM 16219]|jgi:amphi-Trp domain-containing protein|uniref:Amphi-Trp domain-containing protein n=1 Tax=Desulfatibacillum alkenivorans DSM 16219 TaxID=1121393 RepID=A0A1M6YCJ3_9BACT|nr:amphi-Trp domain-containing protein [Desulfatibacillum alkenivorans]SHL15689.1 amphi-Trp domain-containing protein [Desulfatibacillum alkenivorans DSM 16219]